MAALTPKSLNFTAPLLSDGELKRDDLQIDIQRYIDALKVRSNILDANHSLARMMGETLKTNSIAENMQRDVFEGLNPQFLDLDGNNLDTVINWVDLIQEVPVAQFHPVSKPGSDDHSDQALMYQCQLETGIVQLTDKQLNLFRFLQNDCSRPSVFEEDIKKEEDIVAAEATRCEEILETLAKVTESTTNLRDKLRNRLRNCRGLLPGAAENQTQDKGTASATRAVANVDESGIPISRKHRFIPLSEEEQRDADSYVANARSTGLTWAQVSNGYAQRFGVRRHLQYFRRTFPQYAHDEVNSGRA